jgi:MSHA pilin protein MshB
MRTSEIVNKQATNNLITKTKTKIKNKNKVNASTDIKPKTQQGFTLIELVIVVVILGFLAVTAIPKFLDLTDQAKQANIEGMAGGFATGVSLTRAQWEAEGRPVSNSVNRVNYEGTNWVLTTPAGDDSIRAGYPTGTNTGNSTGENMSNARCLELWSGLYQQPPKITSTVADLNNSALSFDYLADVAAVTGFCIFYLKETLNKNAAGDFTNPNGDISVGNNFTYDATTSLVEVNISQL